MFNVQCAMYNKKQKYYFFHVSALLYQYHLPHAYKIMCFYPVEINSAGNFFCIKISRIFPGIVICVYQLRNLFACDIENCKLNIPASCNIEPDLSFRVEWVREILVQEEIFRNFVIMLCNSC